MYDRAGRVHFYLTLFGMLGTFVPMHWDRDGGMLRRVADYAAQFGDWNLVISIASFLLGIAQLVFLYNMIVSWKWGLRATANPWRRREDSSGRFPPRRRSSTSTRSRASSVGRTSSVRPGPGTRSWPARRRRSRRLSPRWSALPVAGGAPTAEGRARDRRRVSQLSDRRHLVARGLGRRRDRAGVSQRGCGRPTAARGAARASGRGAGSVAWRRRRTSRWSGRSSTATSFREVAQSRIDVTQEVLAEFGIEALGAVFDPDPRWRSTTRSAASRRGKYCSRACRRRATECCGATRRVGQGGVRRR